jgi:hypothetical protein
MKKLLLIITAVSCMTMFSCKQEKTEEIVSLVTVTNDESTACHCREIYINSEIYNILPGSSLELKKSYYDFWNGSTTVPAYHLDKDTSISEIFQGE